ncbi:AI-2E family transporter [Flavobacterium sp. SM2513]|uniref:AI-2E family transporter n=1 Tax=Flavobacterium sp. SM2513 TaxID=3424766 RepID=UPI003D7FC322
MNENKLKQEEDADEITAIFTKKVWITAGIITLIGIGIFVFTTLFNLLLLVFAGVLMSVYFHGCASLLNCKINMGKSASLIVSVVVNLVVLVLFFWFVGARLSSQISELSDTLPDTLANAKEWLERQPMGQKLLDYSTNSLDSSKASSTIKAFFSSTFGILSDFYIIVLLGMFLTANPGVYRRGLIHLIRPKGKKEAGDLWDRLAVLLRNWLKGQIFGFFFIAVLSGLGLWALGMPLVLTLALLAGLLNFIPNFGPIIALVPATLLALMQGPETALLVVGLYTAIQVIQSAVTQPLIQKKMVSMPPGLLVFGQVGMGVLAGFWGVLLATPLVAILMGIVNKLYVDKQSNVEKTSSFE